MTANDEQNLHVSVLLEETLALLDPKGGELFIDATLGLGGHTEALLLTDQTVRVIGIDQDTKAMSHAKERLKRFGDRVEFVHANFSDIATIAKGRKVDGILADLGVSSLQFDSGDRGFSFRFDAPLDMRMDADGDSQTAAELLAELDEEDIANLIYKYGEERASRKIARWIVEKRKIGEPITTTTQLARLVERAVPRKGKDQIHPATRTFQALRIAVNDELGVLEGFLKASIDALSKGGRLAVISFHSLEDRIVKLAFQIASGKCQCPPRLPICQCGAEKKVEILTKKPMTAGEDERDINPRARSAKLRAVRKIV